MKCNRCGNEDERYFATDHGRIYCRKCIQFGRLNLKERRQIPFHYIKPIYVKPRLEFELTPFQKQASQKALSVLKAKKDVFVFAAAGAGKTEMTLESICWYLAQGKKVGFAISRRQVVLEIAKRMQKTFPDLKVTPVCQGYTKELDGDLIVCTTHQLYRYPQTFDLLILDELDAFPFAGNAVLNEIAKTSCKGERMLLSATPDEESLQAMEKGEMEMVTLFQRPHGHPLCEPEFKIHSPLFNLMLIVMQCKKLIRQNKQILLFVPTKKECERIKVFLSLFFKVSRIHSSIEDKDAVMNQFYQKEVDVLVCTTLLERGITVGSVQVLVYRADHIVFTTASLIQIFGRVGRTFQDPAGIGICYAGSVSESMSACKKQLKWMNSFVYGARIR